MKLFGKIIFCMTVLVATAQSGELNCRVTYNNGAGVAEVSLDKVGNGFRGIWENKVSFTAVVAEETVTLNIVSLQDTVDFSMSTTHSLGAETPVELSAGFSHGTFVFSCSKN